MIALIETQYIPSIAYFAALHSCHSVIIEKHEHFVKQTYRNRCSIMTSHGVDSLTIPLTGKHGKVKITDVRIDYGQKWLNNHWRTIESAYRNAPYFEHYADDLQAVLFQRYIFLYDLNFSLLSMCLKWLRWEMNIQESLTYEKEPVAEVRDMRSAINPKKTGDLPKYYRAIAYPQVFGNVFAENLSLIDLIFCMGPEAVRIVQASSAQE